MVRRRSTVQFRNGAPAQRGFSNIGFQDQVTNPVMRLQLTAGAARRTRTPVPLWRAAIRLNATASDKTARHYQEKVRIWPLPVSVAKRRGACAPKVAPAFARSPAGRWGSHGRVSDREADAAALPLQHSSRCHCKTLCLTVVVWPTRLPSVPTRRPSTPWT